MSRLAMLLYCVVLIYVFLELTVSGRWRTFFTARPPTTSKPAYILYETAQSIADKWHDLKLVGTCGVCGMDDAPIVVTWSGTDKCKWCAELDNLTHHLKQPRGSSTPGFFATSYGGAHGVAYVEADVKVIQAKKIQDPVILSESDHEECDDCETTIVYSDNMKYLTLRHCERSLQSNESESTSALRYRVNRNNQLMELDAARARGWIKNEEYQALKKAVTKQTQDWSWDA